MNGEDVLGTREKSNQSNSQNTSEGQVGRP